MDRSLEMSGDLRDGWRCLEIWGDVRRSLEMSGDLGDVRRSGDLEMLEQSKMVVEKRLKKR